MVCSVSLLLFAGCGGDSAEEERLLAERVAQARKEGAELERLKAKQREQEREQERLRREIARLRKEASGRSTSGGSGTAPAPLSQGTSCGNGLAVGPNTTCAFAENVREEYRASGGSTVIEAYSPVTKQAYTMTCTGTAVVTCTGGNNATVYFR